MKLTPLGALFALILFGLAAVSAHAQSVDNSKFIWGGGDPKDSVYSSVYVPRVVDVLTQNRLAGYTWGGVSAGTLENAQKVSDNPTNLAVGQWDLLRDLKGKPIPNEPGKVYDFTVLNQDIGPECLYMVTRQEGYNTWGDVLGNAWDMTIATGSELSGSYGTLQVLKGIYPDLKDAVIVTAPSTDAIIKLVQSDPKVTHGFFVMRPDPSSAIFKQISDAKLHIVPVVDYELEKLYSFQQLKVANGGLFGIGGNAQYVSTACTSVALITGAPDRVDPTDTRTLRRVQETISRVKAVPADQLKPNLATWRDMFDSMTAIASDQAKQLMDASKKALDDIAKKANAG